MAARFGTMLQERRRQMGLSIQQVANTVKIRPQIIEYFENGDFAAMPPRGYAQGMISSYARFLGLNPRQVVDTYLEDLHNYENMAPGLGSGTLQDAAAEASPRSSNAQGRFYMVEGTSGSRYGQRPPQAGYVSESTSLHEPLAASRLRSASIVNARDPQAQGRPAESVRYGSGQADAGYRDPGGTGRIGASVGQGSYGQGQGGTSRSTRSGGQSSRNLGSGRSGGPSQTGQLRGGQGRGARTQGYGQGSTQGYNQDAGQVRNQGQGQSGQARRGSGTGGQRAGRSGGILSGVDPRLLVAITAVIVVLLTLGVLGLIKGCTSSADSSTDSVVAGSATTVISSSEATSSSDEADSDDSDADSEAAADSDAVEEETGEEESESTETIVTVSIADDAVAYLEVKLDGVSVVAESVVGPDELEYTVEEQIVITTDSPSDVKVYLNGEKVSYDVKNSGVAKVTITADSSSDDEESTDE